MMDRAMLYDIIYALIARDGREAALFGSSAARAHEAFTRSLAGSAFPEVWFEVPLLGDPWFDLHVPTERSAVSPDMTFSAFESGGYPQAFTWFAQSEHTRQLILSWDVGKGEPQSPAVQLLVSTRDPETTCRFLSAMGKTDAADAYRAFTERLPKGWFACYSGVFPQRSGMNLRVECIPEATLQQAYARDPSLLEEHLRGVGFSAFGDTLLERCAFLASLPFKLEFQFNVLPDGSAGDTFGASLRFNSPADQSSWKAFSVDGEAGALMRTLGEWGLVDDRWRLLANTMFAKRVKLQNESMLIFCYPVFVKLRWVGGEPLDAKTYLMAGAK